MQFIFIRFADDTTRVNKVVDNELAHEQIGRIAGSLAIGTYLLGVGVKLFGYLFSLLPYITAPL